jgi:hypothetical protein
MYPLALAAVAATSFIAGLILLRTKTRWCRECGTTLQCLVCTPHPPTLNRHVTPGGHK